MEEFALLVPQPQGKEMCEHHSDTLINYDNP